MTPPGLRYRFTGHERVLHNVPAAQALPELMDWFGYRRATRPQARSEQSPLDDIRPMSWPSAYTTDLLELLNVLTLVAELEPQQAELLAQVMARPRVTVADLTSAAVLPIPASARAPFPKTGAPKVAAGFEQGTLGH